ncbi:2OG-Fe(II) oxygenase [Streptomyces cinnamoneus]|uniref:Prolyl 4-hydroxylase alpha subunit Fe(2+) 2OG dioxygenase domain-containing protein n=1 Tax=Streptomyces cinnamoneus TaxID=53446 RepID=A0A918TGQ5_STRCJ|nr:2OG-Fe(II) oxygenase [Streptomyces cinnamoneus]GHC44449.1 hypothetical protein GCM10010507_19330 [Streptomyces cinnamoneus]
MDAELTHTTTVMTAHGHGGYFTIHTDATKVPDPSTAVSAIYNLHRRPRGFTGGRLRLYDTAVRNGRAERADTYRTIEPDHDTIVFFPASAFHEVTASACPSGLFADHRFTLTTWISGTPQAQRQAARTPNGALRWITQAAESTRPLPGFARAHHGAAPTPLPETDTPLTWT